MSTTVGGQKNFVPLIPANFRMINYLKVFPYPTSPPPPQTRETTKERPDERKSCPQKYLRSSKRRLGHNRDLTSTPINMNINSLEKLGSMGH